MIGKCLSAFSPICISECSDYEYSCFAVVEGLPVCKPSEVIFSDHLLYYTEVERVQKYCTQVKVPLHY